MNPTEAMNALKIAPPINRGQHAAQCAALIDVLRSAPYRVAGANFSVADITLFVGLSFADFAKIAIPAEYTELTAWRARMGKRISMSGTGS